MTQDIRTIRIATQGPAGPAGLYPQASWSAGNVPYARSTVLAHNSCIWLALRDTSVEPSGSVPDDWTSWFTFGGGSGDMASAIYDPAGINEQLAGLTATQALTHKDLSSGTNTFPTLNQNTTGNAASATRLATARLIDGESFDGSADIAVIAPGTHAAAGKTTPSDGDEMPLADSAASYGLKKLTWSNLKATLKNYFDSLYMAAGETIDGLLPSQSGNSGKYLTTNGANASWSSLSGGGDMTSATYDPAGIDEQLVGLTATQTLTNKTLTSPTINSPSGLSHSDISGLAASATTDATNASNIVSGTLPNARLTAVPNAALANAGITISGHLVALGGSLSLAAADVAGVEAQSALLDDIAALSLAKGDILYYDGAHLAKLAAGTSGQFLKTLGSGAAPAWTTVAGGDLLSTNNLSDLANAATARTNLGLAIGTNVQAYDAQLSSVLRQNSQSANYTTVLSDGGKHILHPAADTTARTFTIDSNANVTYPLGTTLTFVNETGAGALTIAITSDTLVLAGAGTTGSRTLTAPGIATAIKITTTKWMISGTGLS